MAHINIEKIANTSMGWIFALISKALVPGVVSS